MKHKTPDEADVPHTNYIKFSNLPREIQNRLLERQSGNGEAVSIKTNKLFSSLFTIPLCLVWIVLVFYLTNSYLWSTVKIVIIGVISFVVLYFLLNNFYTFIQALTSRSKNFLLITPHHVIDMCFGDVRYCDLEQLIVPDYVHHYQNGRYKYTQVLLKLEGNVTKTFVIKNIGKAEEIVEQISLYKKLFAEASAKNDKAYLDSNNDFIELEDEISKRTTNKPPSTNPRYMFIGAASLLLTIVLMFGATLSNNYYDDKKSWNDAESLNSAASFRKYLQSHANGRWTGNARQKLQALYENATQKYISSLNEGYDKKAADAILQVLKYAKTTQNYRVQIVFERHNEIPQNIVEELKKEFEVKDILPLGDTFSDANMNQRESSLFAVVTDAFKQTIPNDILEFSPGCMGECAIFTVKYKINSKDSLYFDSRQEKLPAAERTFYPGIVIYWNFNIKTPDQPQGYDFELVSSPAKEITYDTNSNDVSSNNDDFVRVLDADKKYIYDSMVASAFDDFKKNLVYRMGIGQAPVKNYDDTPQVEDSPSIKSNEKGK